MGSQSDGSNQTFVRHRPPKRRHRTRDRRAVSPQAEGDWRGGGGRRTMHRVHMSRCLRSAADEMLASGHGNAWALFIAESATAALGATRFDAEVRAGAYY